MVLSGLPVAAQEVLPRETVCIECHGAQSGRLGEPVKLWRESIHAQNGISCNNCHGGDPSDMANAMSPQRGFLGAPKNDEIPDFCGRCHIRVKEDYLQSAHGRALGRGGPQCVTCHGNHAIRMASPDLINRESCTRCHSYGRAETIKSAIVGTDQVISNLEEKLNGLHRLGFDTKEMKDKVFSVRNQFHSLFHSVDVEKVRAQTAGFQKDLEPVRTQVAALQGKLSQRKLWGGAVAFLLFLGGVIALLIHKTYLEEEKG
jgi:hypothetical protein